MRHPIVLLLAGALGAVAQQPHFENARVETKAVTGGLESTMRSVIAAQSTPAWIGYAVAIVPGDRQMCGWDNGQSTTRGLSLEGSTTMFVLYRLEQRAVTKLRLATPDCDIDAGGLPVVWLTGVDAGESVRYLESFIGAGRMGDPALLAISLHNHPSATPVLIRTAREHASAHVRGQALFWLAQSAQRKLALDTAAAAIENDPETEVKKKAVFAISQLRDGEGVPKLIELAKSNRNPAVRKQAIFWLGQSKDPRALQFFEEILAR